MGYEIRQWPTQQLYTKRIYSNFFRYLFARFRIVCPTNSVRYNDCYIKAVRKISSNIYVWIVCVRRWACVSVIFSLSFGSDAIWFNCYISWAFWKLQWCVRCTIRLSTVEVSLRLIGSRMWSGMCALFAVSAGHTMYEIRFVLFISFLPRTKLLLSTRIIQSWYEDIPAMRASWICFHMFQVTPDYSFSTIIFFHYLACHIISLLAIGDGDGRWRWRWRWWLLVAIWSGLFLSRNFSFIFDVCSVRWRDALDKDKSPQCDYDGMTCLDKADLVFPQTSIMQPWRPNGLVCKCLPSCNEHEIKLIGRTYM